MRTYTIRLQVADIEAVSPEEAAAFVRAAIIAGFGMNAAVTETEVEDLGPQTWEGRDITAVFLAPLQDDGTESPVSGFALDVDYID